MASKKDLIELAKAISKCCPNCDSFDSEVISDMKTNISGEKYQRLQCNRCNTRWNRNI